MTDEKDFENGRISNFQCHLPLTVTLDLATWHTVVHHSSTPTYVSNFTEIGRKNSSKVASQFSSKFKVVTQKLGQISKIRPEQI